jgi:hypothetical protein
MSAGNRAPRAARAALSWAVAVVGSWVLATGVLTIIEPGGSGHHSVAPVLAHFARGTFVLCFAVGGSGTAAALALAPTHRARTAIAAGIAVAALVFVIIFVFALNGGTTAIARIAPAVVVVASEFSVAFLLRRRSPRPPGPGPVVTRLAVRPPI